MRVPHVKRPASLTPALSLDAALVAQPSMSSQMFCAHDSA